MALLDTLDKHFLHVYKTRNNDIRFLVSNDFQVYSFLFINYTIVIYSNFQYIAKFLFALYLSYYQQLVNNFNF